MTMQVVIRKLILGGVSYPVTEDLPKTRVDTLRALERELKLTQACLSSYVTFKRESLTLIYELNQGRDLEDDNLETQSSLDGSEAETPPVERPRRLRIVEESKE